MLAILWQHTVEGSISISVWLYPIAQSNTISKIVYDFSVEELDWGQHYGTVSRAVASQQEVCMFSPHTKVFSWYTGQKWYVRHIGNSWLVPSRDVTFSNNPNLLNSSLQRMIGTELWAVKRHL